MTTMNEAREAVYDRFNIQWASQTRFTFEGEAFKPTEVDLSWVRLSVRNTGSSQETLGPKNDRKFRRTGIAALQIYTVASNGLRAGDLLGEVFRGIFEGVSFSGLDFNNCVVRESGPDGKWYLHIAEAFFDYEVTK